MIPEESTTKEIVFVPPGVFSGIKKFGNVKFKSCAPPIIGHATFGGKLARSGKIISSVCPFKVARTLKNCCGSEAATVPLEIVPRKFRNDPGVTVAGVLKVDEISKSGRIIVNVS